MVLKSVDNAVGETESVDDIFKKLDCLLCSSRDKWFVLDPLGELVDGDIYVLETTRHWLERLDHVQSPACERPGS